MSDVKGPTLVEVLNLKIRLRTLPDELHAAREVAARLGAEVKGMKTAIAERTAETRAFARAKAHDPAHGKKLTEAALTTASALAVQQDGALQTMLTGLRGLELRHEDAELLVRHLTDRFMGLQVYADLTCAEVRLLVAGLGA